MRSIVVARLALLLVAVGVCGQTPQKTVPATLLTTIDAQKAKAGDEIAARTSEAVKEDGRMVVPKGAKLMGHVVEVKVRGDDQPSRLVLSFDRAVPDGGKEIPINAAIASISRTQGTAAPSNMQQGDMGVPSRAGDAAAAAKQGHSSGSPAAPPARAGTKEHSGPSTGEFTLQQHATRTVISSNSENVRLATGTQLLMQITLNK